MFEAQRAIMRRETIKTRRDTAPLVVSRRASAHSKRTKSQMSHKAIAEHPEVEIRIPHESPSKERDSALSSAKNNAVSSTSRKKEESDMKPEIRGVKNVDWRVIEATVCKKPECMVEVEKGKYNGMMMHRHTGEDCKAHKFCIADRLEEKVPTKESLPQPLPFTIKPLPDE